MNDHQRSQEAGGAKTAAWVISMVRRHGAPEERQLVSRWADTITRFWGAADNVPTLHPPVLTLGLSSQTILRFGVIGSGPGPRLTSLVDRIGGWAPSLGAVCEAVVAGKMRCDATLTVTAANATYGLRIVDAEDNPLARHLLQGATAKAIGLPSPPSRLEIFSSGELHACAMHTVPGQLAAAQLGGVPLLQDDLTVTTLHCSGLRQRESWQSEGVLLDVRPFPSHTLTMALKQLNLRFTYLIHRGGIRSFGTFQPGGLHHALETPVHPLATAPAKKVMPVTVQP